MVSEEQKHQLKSNKELLVDYILRNGGRMDGKKITCLLHNDHNPSASILKNPQGEYSVYCHSCNNGAINGRAGDIFNLIGYLENISEFPKQVERAAEMAGIVLENKKNDAAQSYTPMQQKQPQKTLKNDAGEPKKKSDYKDKYKEWNEHLNEINAKEESHYLKDRRISMETANKHNIGYADNFKVGGLLMKRALIIPLDASTFIARNTDLAAEKGDRFRKVGANIPFNSKALKGDAPIFLVEGQLDALSIIECGGAAMAIGTNGKTQLLLDAIKENPPKKPFIIALDNDDAGERGIEQLKETFDANNIEYVVDRDILGTSLYSWSEDAPCKDANDALKASADMLKGRVQLLAAAAEKAIKGEKEIYEERHKASRLASLFFEKITNKDTPPAIPTGFLELDKVLDGGLHEGLYIVGAISSLGKTTLVTQIADQIAAAGKDVLFFTLEMSREEIIAKSISRLTSILAEQENKPTFYKKSNRNIASKFYECSEQEQDFIAGAFDAFNEELEGIGEHLYIHEGVGDIGVKEIAERVAQHKRLTGNSPVVVIDYLQILAPYDAKATDKQNIDKAVLEVKRLSRDYKIAIIGISAFNRANYNERVNMASFIGSSGIEYGCDVLIGLQLEGAGGKDFNVDDAKKRNPRAVELKILKNRNGRTGDSFFYEYYPVFNQFKERR